MAEGGEEIREAMSPSVQDPEEEMRNVPLRTGRFEDEWEEMKSIIFQQSRTINAFSTQIMNLQQELPSPSQKQTVITKPRDVPILNLQKIEGLESAGTLNIFFFLTL